MVPDQVSRDGDVFFSTSHGPYICDIFYNMRTGVIGMDNHFSMTAYIRKTAIEERIFSE
jgi:hypothetical protein